VTKINRIISTVILAASFSIMAIVPDHPASLLFIFISGNKWVGTIRMIIALVLLALSFNLIRPSESTRKPLLYGGVSLIFFGLISLLATSLGSFLYDYVKIMDVYILLETGIISCSIALTAEPAPSRTVTAKSKAKRAKAKVLPA